MWCSAADVKSCAMGTVPVFRLPACPCIFLMLLPAPARSVSPGTRTNTTAKSRSAVHLISISADRRSGPCTFPFQMITNAFTSGETRRLQGGHLLLDYAVGLQLPAAPGHPRVLSPCSPMPCPASFGNCYGGCETCLYRSRDGVKTKLACRGSCGLSSMDCFASHEAAYITGDQLELREEAGTCVGSIQYLLLK